MKSFLCCLTASIFVLTNTLGQKTIELTNPSFEDLPRKGMKHISIKGWHDCGATYFPQESPPDILPTPDHAWEVSKKAFHGLTYISLVTRATGSYESVSQPLTYPLKAGQCYTMSVYLARSGTYKSAVPTSRPGELEDFTRPVELLIWGGSVFCEKEELLAQSGPVKNEDWTLFEFTFSPMTDCKYFTVEAYYVTPVLESYNGHVLADHFSSIQEVDCK